MSITLKKLPNVCCSLLASWSKLNWTKTFTNPFTSSTIIDRYCTNKLHSKWTWSNESQFLDWYIGIHWKKKLGTENVDPPTPSPNSNFYFSDIAALDWKLLLLSVWRGITQFSLQPFNTEVWYEFKSSFLVKIIISYIIFY